MRIGRGIRLVVVVAVVALMSYVTWLVHEQYWQHECFRTVSPGMLYVVRRADTDMLSRFRSRFANTTLLDLRTDGERAAAPLANSAENNERTVVMRLSLEAGRVPTSEEIGRFLELAANNKNLPLMLYAGPCPEGTDDLRAACLAAAFECLLVGRPLNEALAEALPDKSSPHREALREAILTASRNRPSVSPAP